MMETVFIRFALCPPLRGVTAFTISADFLEKEETGSFVSLPAGEGNHGPVRVADTYHFAYEDGTRYYSIGTTCYVWDLQSDERIAQTLETLKASAFNKIRFCIFPSIMTITWESPDLIPMRGTPMVPAC